MSKAVLVIDMPNSCKECPVRSFVGYGKWCAGHDDTCIDNYPTKPNWCPLKELPEKMEGYDSIKWQWGEYEDGWNHCIDCLIDE